jgi:flagellin-like hook-associated protein FlgL
MRIAGNTAMRRYVNNLQRNFFNKNESENKIIANRKFTRASQSPLDAAKALRVRKSMSEVETYQRNLESAAGIYESAEGAIMQVSSIMQTLHEKMIAGATGTFSVYPDKQIIAEEITQLAKQMVSLMNLDAAGRRIFGGVSNSDLLPFQEVNGQILYNGVNVNQHNNHNDFPFSQRSFLDVGIGFAWLDEFTVDPQTGIPTTFNGAQALGSGIDSDTFNVFRFSLPADGGTLNIGSDSATANPFIIAPGESMDSVAGRLREWGLNVVVSGGDMFVQMKDNSEPLMIESDDIDITHGFPRNIIQLTLDAANAVRSGDNGLIMQYAEMLFQSGSFLSMSIARIGSETAFIEFNQERLANNMLSLKEQQNLLEHPDMGEEITKQKVLEMIYNATLQMSAQTIPMSIFNFMR